MGLGCFGELGLGLDFLLGLGLGLCDGIRGFRSCSHELASLSFLGDVKLICFDFIGVVFEG